MGIREIALITATEMKETYHRLLRDGSRFGAAFTYLTQSEPGGIAQAFLIARSFVGEERVCLLLGDNILLTLISIVYPLWQWPRKARIYWLSVIELHLNMEWWPSLGTVRFFR